MPSVADQITEYIASRLGAQAERWALQALNKIETSSPLEEFVLDVARRFVDEHGSEIAADKIRNFVDALKRDGDFDIDVLDELSADELSRLTELMQEAEAEERTKAKRFGRTLGVALKGLSSILITAVRVAL